VEDGGSGKTRRVPLVAYCDESAEVHRREKPGSDGNLWDVYASFAETELQGKCPGKWKELLVEGCKVHALVIGFKMLRASKVAPPVLLSLFFKSSRVMLVLLPFSPGLLRFVRCCRRPE